MQNNINSIFTQTWMVVLLKTKNICKITKCYTMRSTFYSLSISALLPFWKTYEFFPTNHPAPLPPPPPIDTPRDCKFFAKFYEIPFVNTPRSVYEIFFKCRIPLLLHPPSPTISFSTVGELHHWPWLTFTCNENNICPKTWSA